MNPSKNGRVLPDILVVLIALLLTITCVLPARGDDCVKARELFQQAIHLNAGSPVCDEECLRQKVYFYQQALQLCPDYPEAHNNLGDAFENQGKYQEAIKEYLTAIEIAPNFTVPHYGLGDIYFKNGRYEVAIQYYKKGIALDHSPGSSDAVYSQEKILQAEDLLNKDVIGEQTIISVLKPPVKRGLGGIRETNSPQITFDNSAIPFDFDSDRLRPDAKAQLNELGKALSSEELGGEYFEIGGHTDIRGTEEYNLQLSKRRAESVKVYLTTQFNMSPVKLIVEGYGESSLIAYADDELSHTRNRRVVIRKLDAEEVSTLEVPPLSVFVSFLHKDNTGSISPMREGMTLTANDGYKVFFEPEQDCYVYIFQKDTKDQVDTLFISRQPVKAQKAYWVPNINNWFFLDQSKGEETIYLLATLEPARDIENVLSKLTTGSMGKDEKQETVEEVIYQVRSRTRSVAAVESLGKTKKKTHTAEVDFDFHPELMAGEGGFHCSITFKHD